MQIVIMAGGSGTRFWPLSRASHPKQFLKIVGDDPMLVTTYKRIEPLVSEPDVLFVVGRDHQAETERLMAGKDVKIMVEPVGRNTAPAIGLAAAWLDRHGRGGEPMAVLPADHFVAQPDLFRESLQHAAEVARDGSIVTLGIVPTRPETGYGYIERDSASSLGNDVYEVKKFVEKPNLHIALEYMASGEFYWNAGVFVATPKALLEEFAALMPDFYEGLTEVAEAFGKVDFETRLEALYNHTPSISFDYAVMEKTRRKVRVIACDCGWSDVGSWSSLFEARGGDQDEQGNVAEGDTLVLGCRDSFILARSNRWIAAMGLTRVLIVDTPDALLVSDLEKSQEVREVTSILNEKGKSHLL
jgi:mannose-1-phosphate guanylyltransferase